MSNRKNWYIFPLPSPEAVAALKNNTSCVALGYNLILCFLLVSCFSTHMVSAGRHGDMPVAAAAGVAATARKNVIAAEAERMPAVYFLLGTGVVIGPTFWVSEFVLKRVRIKRYLEKTLYGRH